MIPVNINPAYEKIKKNSLVEGDFGMLECQLFTDFNSTFPCLALSYRAGEH